MIKYFKWLITEVNSDGWKLFYWGACAGAVVAILFSFPFRYRILEVNNPHMRPIWLKFDRLTGTAWKSDGYGLEWVQMTNRHSFTPPSLSSIAPILDPSKPYDMLDRVAGDTNTP